MEIQKNPEGGEMKENDAKFFKVMFFLTFIALVVLAFHDVNELTRLNNLVKAATYLNDGKVEKAVDEVDNVDPKVGDLTGSSALLASQVRAKYSLFLVDLAQREYNRGDIPRAENDLGVAEKYAYFSGTTLPPSAARLKDALSKK